MLASFFCFICILLRIICYVPTTAFSSVNSIHITKLGRTIGTRIKYTTLRMHTNKTQLEEMDGVFEITRDQREALLSVTDDSNAFDDILVKRLRDFYNSQGYVLIRGLLDQQTVKELNDAGNQVIDKEISKSNSLFTSIQFGPIYAINDEETEQLNVSPFRKVATKSAIPAFIAKILFQLSSSDEMITNLRVLNDVFLAKTGQEESFCGWHVDDMGKLFTIPAFFHTISIP